MLWVGVASFLAGFVVSFWLVRLGRREKRPLDPGLWHPAFGGLPPVPPPPDPARDGSPSGTQPAVEKGVGMARCPVCASPRIVVIIDSGRRAFCGLCGADWIQEGSEQRRVRPRLTRAQPAGRSRAPARMRDSSGADSSR